MFPLILIGSILDDGRVCSLAISPVNDSFMSGSLDQTVQIWDLRSSQPEGILSTGSMPCVQYDPKG
jgi:COMPASS component SWD2